MWTLDPSGAYTCKSFFGSVTQNPNCYHRHFAKVFWKAKVPSVVKFFAWTSSLNTVNSNELLQFVDLIENICVISCSEGEGHTTHSFNVMWLGNCGHVCLIHLVWIGVRLLWGVLWILTFLVEKSYQTSLVRCFVAGLWTNDYRGIKGFSKTELSRSNICRRRWHFWSPYGQRLTENFMAILSPFYRSLVVIYEFLSVNLQEAICPTIVHYLF